MKIGRNHFSSEKRSQLACLGGRKRLISRWGILIVSIGPSSDSCALRLARCRVCSPCPARSHAHGQEPTHAACARRGAARPRHLFEASVAVPLIKPPCRKHITSRDSSPLEAFHRTQKIQDVA
jgi:hypothetical protein